MFVTLIVSDFACFLDLAICFDIEGCNVKEFHGFLPLGRPFDFMTAGTLKEDLISGIT